MQRSQRSFSLPQTSRRYLHAWLAFGFFFAVAACDKSGDATAPGDTAPADGAEPDASAGGCGDRSPTEPCMNDENFAQCQEMEAKCPGEVLVLESCPLQFACP